METRAAHGTPQRHGPPCCAVQLGVLPAGRHQQNWYVMRWYVPIRAHAMPARALSSKSFIRLHRRVIYATFSSLQNKNKKIKIFRHIKSYA
jgi:hypothetical protein